VVSALFVSCAVTVTCPAEDVSVSLPLSEAVDVAATFASASFLFFIPTVIEITRRTTNNAVNRSEMINSFSISREADLRIFRPLS